jgi:hypothetical protein
MVDKSLNSMILLCSGSTLFYRYCSSERKLPSKIFVISVYFATYFSCIGRGTEIENQTDEAKYVFFQD